MTTTGVLRKATAADIEGIKDVIDANLGKLLPRAADEIAQLIEHFYVIDEGGLIVGCCCLEVYSAKIAEIRSLAVLDDRRGHNYGNMLVQQCIADAQARQIPEVLVVTSTPEFFERLNFGLCLNEKYAMFWSGVTPEFYHSPTLSSEVFHHTPGQSNGVTQPANGTRNARHAPDNGSGDSR